MEKRELYAAEAPEKYFAVTEEPEDYSADEDSGGTRDLFPLYPFIVSGGSNTERYYFLHVSNETSYKFNVYPRYFGGESDYTTQFPLRIHEILSKNAGAKVFCVFDWDTVRENPTNRAKHDIFVKNLKTELDSGAVVLCPSMPSIEYWFLLHFENRKTLIRNAGRVIGFLAPHMRPYFPDATVSLSKVLKAEKYLSNADWVKQLCAGGKLEAAIRNAEANIRNAKVGGTLDAESYSYVYKAFDKAI